MELRLKLRFAGIVLAIFFVMIIFDWYKNIDEVSVYDEKIEERIPSGDLYLYSKKYTNLDMNKEYKWYNVNSVRKTKSAIPFFYDREIIRSTNREILLISNH